MDWAIVGASFADLATTEWAIHQPGLAEGNALMREPVQRYALKLAATAAVVGSYRALKKRKKNRAAKVLAITACALWGGAAINNAIQASRH